MQVTKEAELNEAIFRFAHRCLAEGDLQSLNAFGFQRCDLDRLRDIPYGAVLDLGSTRAHMLRTQALDRDSLYQLLRYMEVKGEQKALCAYLIRNHAPRDMLSALLGLSSTECAELRQALGVQSTTGRSKDPTPEDERAVWDACKALHIEDVDKLTAREWVALYEHCQRTSQVSLRNVWRLVNKWYTEVEASTWSPSVHHVTRKV